MGSRRPKSRRSPLFGPEEGFEDFGGFVSRWDLNSERLACRFCPFPCRANMAHSRQSGPDSGLAFQAYIFKKVYIGNAKSELEKHLDVRPATLRWKQCMLGTTKASLLDSGSTSESASEERFSNRFAIFSKERDKSESSPDSQKFTSGGGLPSLKPLN